MMTQSEEKQKIPNLRTMERTTTMYLIVFLVFGSVIFRHGYAEECQSGCTCANTDSTLTLTCSGFPDSITKTTNNLTVIGKPLFEFQTKSVASFVELRTLVLNDLEISSVKHEATSGIRLDQLKTLSLRNNVILQLTKDVFSWCPNVAELRLSSNKIKYIEKDVLASLKFLKMLDLANNNLQTNNFDIPISLEVLDLNNNQIFDLERAVLPNLRELRLCGNHFANPSSLENLDIRNVNSLCIGDTITSIDSLSLTNMPDIKRLELVGKALIDVKLMDEIKILDQLQVLTLSFFRYGAVTAEMFRGFDHLVELHLDNVETEVFDRDAFEPLSNLRLLDLHGSSDLVSSILTTENVAMPKTIRTLSFRETKLTRFDSKTVLRFVPNLINLDISLNPIECNGNMRELVRTVLQSELSMINVNDTKCDSPKSLRGKEVFKDSTVTEILRGENRKNSTSEATTNTKTTINFIMKALGLTLEHLFYIVIALSLLIFVLTAVIIALHSNLSKKTHRRRRNGSSESFVTVDNEYTFDNFTLSETLAECRRPQCPK